MVTICGINPPDSPSHQRDGDPESIKPEEKMDSNNGCGATGGCGCISLIVALVVVGVAILIGVPLLKVAAIAAVIIGVMLLIGLGLDILVAIL